MIYRIYILDIFEKNEYYIFMNDIYIYIYIYMMMMMILSLLALK